jgi:hypothetical protein
MPSLQHIIISHKRGILCFFERPKLEVEAGFGLTISTLRHINKNTGSTFSNDVERRAREPPSHIQKWLARRVGSNYFFPLFNELYEIRSVTHSPGTSPESNLCCRPVE